MTLAFLFILCSNTSSPEVQSGPLKTPFVEKERAMSESQSITSCIYLARNNLTGKCYVGKTICSLQRRRTHHECLAKNGSKFYFHSALRKYGTENFEWLEIAHATDNATLYELEQEYIALLGTKAPGGYNMTDGGDGAWEPTEETKAAQREKMRRFRHSEASKAIMREFQSNRTPEHCANLGKALNGRAPLAAIKASTEARRRRTGLVSYNNTKGYSKQGNGFRVECNTANGRVRKYVRTEEDAITMVAKVRSGFTA